VAVVGTGQERRELDLLQIRLEAGDGGLELPRELGIVRIVQELVDRQSIIEFALQGIEAIELAFQTGERRGDALALRGVVPERGIGRLLLQIRRLGPLGVDVKGTPWPRRRVPRGPAGVRCDRSSPRECIDPAIVRR
jgi:hypothetical protein